MSSAGGIWFGAYTMAVYFTSEAAARRERKQPPPELQAQMEEMAALSVGEPEFFDLQQPWLYSPRRDFAGRQPGSPSRAWGQRRRRDVQGPSARASAGSRTVRGGYAHLR
jgi:hypothetical protein